MAHSRGLERRVAARRSASLELGAALWVSASLWGGAAVASSSEAQTSAASRSLATVSVRAPQAPTQMVLAQGASTASPTQALPSASARSLGLLEAWRAAVQEESTLRTARAAADSQLERLPQAQARLRPNLGFSASVNRNDLSRTQGSGDTQLSTDEKYNGQNYTLNLRQPLYRPALMLDLRQADQSVIEAQATVESETRNLAVRLTGAYLEALLAQDQLRLVRVQEHTLRTQLAAVQSAFAAGSGVRTDIDEVQARLDLNQAQRLEAEQQIDSTRRQIAVLVQRPFGDLKGLPATGLTLPALESGDIEAWIRRSEASSPELRTLSARRDAARLEVDKAGAARKPTVDLVGQVIRSSSENIVTPALKYQNRSIGLQLNVPLYTGGLIDSGVRQATADLMRAEEALEGARRELSVRVHREYRSATEGERRIQALMRAIQSAEQLVTSNRRSMQAGSRTIIDVLNAEQQLALVQRDLAQARYTTALARLRLAMLAGDAVETSIQRLDAAFGGEG